MLTAAQIANILDSLGLTHDEFDHVLSSPTVGSCVKDSPYSTLKEVTTIDKLFVSLVHPRLDRDEVWSLRWYDEDQHAARTICHYLLEENGINKGSFLKLIQTRMCAKEAWPPLN